MYNIGPTLILQKVYSIICTKPHKGAVHKVRHAPGEGGD